MKKFSACALILFWLALCLQAAAAPKRIVSLAPSITEILYGVGAFPNVVAVTQYCTYPPEVSRLPRVGGWQTTHVEKIVALHPDLVVITKPQEQFLADRLRAFDVPFTTVPSESLADIFTSIELIGHATGHDREANALTEKMHASLDAIRDSTKHLPRPTVLLSISRTPGTLSEMYVATEGSYMIDLINLAGGRSIVTPAPTGFGKVSKEVILSLNPDLIIDLVHSSQSTLGERPLDAWNDLPELKAVRSRAIHPVNDPFVVHPSQFVVHTAELFLHILHPEAAVSSSQ